MSKEKLTKAEKKAARAAKKAEGKTFGQEFKAFITRGNVVDMAVGVVVGGAFTAIINSLVNDIINPLLGLLTAGTVSSLSAWTIDFPGQEETVVSVKIGSFLAAIVNFLIIAFVIFLVVKGINKVRDAGDALKNKLTKKEEEAAPEAPAEEPAPEPEAPAAPAVNEAELAILAEIRDLLREKQA